MAFAQVQESAYLLSLDHHREGLSPDPLRDWLDAEWIHQNSRRHRELMLAVFTAINDAGASMNPRALGYCSGLIADPEIRWRLTATLGANLASFGISFDVAAMAQNSKTAGGLVAMLVSRFRTEKITGMRKGPDHSWIRRYASDYPLPPNGFVFAIPEAAFITEPFYSIARGLRMLGNQLAIFGSMSAADAATVAYAIKQSDLPLDIAWGDFQVDAALICGHDLRTVMETADRK